MICSGCGSDIDTPDKFCPVCGNCLVPTDTITRPLPTSPVPETVPIEEIKDSSNNLQNKKKVRITPQKKDVGPNVNWSRIHRWGLLSFLILMLSTIIMHILAEIAAKKYLISLPDESPLVAKPGREDLVLSGIQTIISAIFVIVANSRLGVSNKGKILWNEIAQNAFQQFLQAWSILWVTWFLLYLYIFIILIAHGAFEGLHNATMQITVDFLNITNSAVFFCIFLVLDMPSVSTETEPRRNRDFLNSFFGIALICLAVFFFSSFSRLSPHNPLGIYASGLLVAISMAFVFGRLDSHHMDVNRWALAALYSYAIIQLRGPILLDFSRTDSTPDKILFFAAALILKIVLFGAIFYWLSNGAFEQYFNAVSKDIEEKRKKNKS